MSDIKMYRPATAAAALAPSGTLAEFSKTPDPGTGSGTGRPAPERPEGAQPVARALYPK